MTTNSAYPLQRDEDYAMSAGAGNERYRPVVLTMRKPSGEFIRKQAAYPTACPGVYRFPLPDECELCWCYEEFGYCDGVCGLPTTFSWHLVCEAGVILSSFGYEKSTVEAIAARLIDTPIDFTLPLEEIVAACQRPEAQSVRQIVVWGLGAEVAS